MADDKLTNFIPISRKIFNHELWNEKREFSKFEAWVDLIQTARFDSGERTEWVNNKPVTFGRGQLIGSVRFLQKRWNWGSTSKVDRYLNVLKKQNMVDLKTEQGVNVITICKYDDYNKKDFDYGTPTRHGTERQQDKTNTVNKENNIYNAELPLATTGSDVPLKPKTHDLFIEFFNYHKGLVTGRKGQYTATTKVISVFKVRFKKYGNEKMKITIRNAFRDRTHIENNFKYVTPEFVLREDIIERYINIPEPTEEETNNLFQQA